MAAATLKAGARGVLPRRTLGKTGLRLTTVSRACVCAREVVPLMALVETAEDVPRGVLLVQ